MTHMITALFPRQTITGVVLAGGRGSRMGGADKGLVDLHGKPMVAHAIDALRPQVGRLLINANRHLDQYMAFGCDVVPDALDGYLGPLAGLASAMQAAATQYVVTVPCDSPLLPDDLVERWANDGAKRVFALFFGWVYALLWFVPPLLIYAVIQLFRRWYANRNA